MPRLYRNLLRDACHVPASDVARALRERPYQSVEEFCRRRITGLPTDGNEERLSLCVAAQEDAHEARDIFASEKRFIRSECLHIDSGKFVIRGDHSDSLLALVCGSYRTRPSNVAVCLPGVANVIGRSWCNQQRGN